MASMQTISSFIYFCVLLGIVASAIAKPEVLISLLKYFFLFSGDLENGR